MKIPYDGSNTSHEALESLARKAAQSLSRGDEQSVGRHISRAKRELRAICTAHNHAAQYAKEHVSLPQAAEWLLDNRYIAERECKSACADLKSFHMLPGAGAGRLIVTEAARLFVSARDCQVTGDALYSFLDAFQDVLRLSEEELCAFIPSVRLELLTVLASGCKTLPDALTSGESDSLAASFGNIFTSLRFLSGYDTLPLIEGVNRIERALRKDPAGLYSEMDDDTRRSYRREIARLARLNNVDEQEAALYAIELSQPDEHIGHYIFREPLGSPKKRRTGNLYIGFIILSTLFAALFTGFLTGSPAIPLLLIIPISEIIKNITDYFVQRFVRPQRVERLELADGIPAEGKTICAVSVLLSSEKNGKSAAGLLDEYRISNRDAGKNLHFALLADLPEANSEETSADAAIISGAAAEIARLNEKYGGGFYLLYRKRVKNDSGRWGGWERKRGAILELCRLLRGTPSGVICAAGNPDALKAIKYIIALDIDTRLSAGTARELTGAAMHPLNRPVIDGITGVVTEGSGVIQPRVSVDLHSAGSTDFTLFFAGQGGIDPYGGAASDLYQNMFGTGSFTGKGIIDIDAYLTCLDTRFPENRVLSHDLLEGAFLRCTFAGDVELTDGFPSNIKSYYSRTHRWTRGDWQTIPWLFSRIRNAEGALIENPLTQIDKWKIIDNIRRSLVPPLLTASLLTGMLLSNYVFVTVFLTACLTIFIDLVISGAVTLFRERGGRVRYISSVISGFGGQLVKTLVKLMLLPFEAWITFSAAVTALFRMCVTKKKLLEWTTAADSERRAGGGAVSYYIRMWPCVAAAAAVILFTPHVPAAAIGIVWFFAPLYSHSLGRVKKPRREISTENRHLLSRCAGDQWRYFEELLTPEDNYLPPDNYQEQPSVGTAHRTSPTNIGLALISALAAIDLGTCRRETAISLIANMLTTIEKLPKWRGHLYNWYETTTLKVLNPAYVSTVDCGNLAGCLIALQSGLIEHGETELARRTELLLSEMSFTPLFDTSRMLFHIGWDCTKNEPSESWYDLLASEAMLTSYIAIARGDIPRKHWRRLGRSLVSLDGYRGMVSWTGTMFEYLMPELLVPCYRDSLIYESLKFCVYVQKKHSSGRPWGMSESAFYDFDHTLSYRYKAHGAARLALKRGMDRDIVISPYSTFLALSVDLKAALYNLRRLQKLGAEGRYGFFEALDYTPSRQRNREFEIVRTYMAHHVGMSLVSIDNVLNNGIMQKRFMRNGEMSAFRELLQEKVPVGGVVLRQPPREVPEKPFLRAAASSWSFEANAIDTTLPRCCLLGNGAYSVMMAETGQSRSVWNGVTLTRTSRESTGTPCGMAFLLKCGDELFSLLPSPVFDPSAHYDVHMTGGVCRISAKGSGLDTSVTVTVPEGDAGELRTVEISSNTYREAELVVYFEPVLSRSSDFEAHPAFSKLSLETSIQDGTIAIRRRPRFKAGGLAMAFGCDMAYSFDTSRELALGRGGFLRIPHALRRDAGGTVGSVLDPCVLMRVKLRLDPNTRSRVSFALAPSWNTQNAAAAVKRILEDNGRSASPRVDETASRLGLTPEQTESAMAMLSEIVYPSPYRRIPAEFSEALSKGQSAMWPLGVSGDFPILSAIIATEQDVMQSAELIKLHAFLIENGASLDLVLLLSDSGDYRGGLRNGVSDIIASLGFEWRLGARCGIHLADILADGSNTVRSASFRVIASGEKFAPLHERCEGSLPFPLKLYNAALPDAPETAYNDDGSFTFLCDGTMPHNSWSHILSNSGFGYIASDSGTGHMWHKNSRENKINRWLNDSLSTVGTEVLQLRTVGEKISLFAAPDGYPCSVTYGFGYARWEKNIGNIKTSVTAFIPTDIACRVLIIESDADGEIEYCTDLVLGESEAQSVYVTTERSGEAITAKNTYSADFTDTVFTHLASRPDKHFTCSKADYLTGEYSGTTGSGYPPCIAAVYPSGGTLIIVSGCASKSDFIALADEKRAYGRLVETIDYWRGVTSRLTVKTPSEKLNRYLNGWAIYQTYACRVLGRSSLYQSGGAYGFRDQLQDVCALSAVVPEETRAQIIRAAEHQYEEGDVQHWWHPGTDRGDLSDKGVRTKCSDDLLWLPYALCEYIDRTGDLDICDYPARFIVSTPLEEDEAERYEQPRRSVKLEPLLSHAMRAIDLVLTRGTGRHGLCLIGGGDWNDGMNMVGAGGQGESVWLTWFLIHTAERFAALCEKRGNPGAASRYRDAAESYRHAAESAWDGNWYLRGYFDDGTPLGGVDCEECRIDSIAQSFAVLAGADPERIKIALENAAKLLFDRENGIIKLFDPPFSDGRTSPGYIKGYSPGFRENGGQYTHGAIWLAMAMLMQGMTETGLEMLEAILPHDKPHGIYRAEPYVLAADVYSNKQHVGRGGWTWYTGASGWFYRTAVENLLGLTLNNGVLNINSCLPPGWDGYEAVWKNGGAEYRIEVKKDGKVCVTRDGRPVVSDPSISLVNMDLTEI